MNKSYITSIGTANPPHRFEQKTILEFMQRAHKLNGQEAQRLQALYRASGIKYRYSVIPDYGNQPKEFEFYPKNDDLEPFPSVSQRMASYDKEALALAQQAVENCFSQNADTDPEKLTHLITVSCTGMVAPGLDLQLVEALGLSTNIQRTAINFMGCYAAFNALKMAHEICLGRPEAKVLIVCLELCTLHFQKKNDEDSLLSNALFGDGAAAVLVNAKPSKRINLAMDSFFCDVAFQGKNEMAWGIGDFGFEMKLSSYVPGFIQKGIKELCQKLLEKEKIDLEAIDFFAVHPGGKKILQTVDEELQITQRKSRFGYEILKNYGNMSSPTILFVLKALWNQLAATDNDKKILGFAFGPGLTMESMLMHVNVSEK